MLFIIDLVYYSYLDIKKLRLPVQSSLAVISSRALRLVVKDLLNLLHDLIVKLLVEIKCLEIVLKLLNLCRAKNDGADVGVLEGPGKRQLGDVSSETLSNFGHLPDLLDLGLSSFCLELVDCALEEGLVGSETRVFGNTVVVLSGEETAGKRGPDGGSVLELVVEGSVLDLEALTVQSVILRLLNN